jgi:hypothetical protein
MLLVADELQNVERFLGALDQKITHRFHLGIRAWVFFSSFVKARLEGFADRILQAIPVPWTVFVAPIAHFLQSQADPDSGVASDFPIASNRSRTSAISPIFRHISSHLPHPRARIRRRRKPSSPQKS